MLGAVSGMTRLSKFWHQLLVLAVLSGCAGKEVYYTPPKSDGAVSIYSATKNVGIYRVDGLALVDDEAEALRETSVSPGWHCIYVRGKGILKEGATKSWIGGRYSPLDYSPHEASFGLCADFVKGGQYRIEAPVGPVRAEGREPFSLSREYNASE